MNRAGLMVGLLATASYASGVVSTNGMSDTSAAQTTPRSTVIVDARATTSDGAVGTGLSVLGGLADWLELGVSSSMSIGFTEGVTAGVVSSWAKASFLRLESTTFGVLLGSLVDLYGGGAFQLGGELAMTQKVRFGTLDANLGVAGTAASGVIGHASVCANVSLPAYFALLGETFGYLSRSGPPSMGERLGVSWSSEHLSVDVSFAVLESFGPSVALSYVPQVGTSLTF